MLGIFWPVIPDAKRKTAVEDLRLAKGGEAGVNAGYGSILFWLLRHTEDAPTPPASNSGPLGAHDFHPAPMA